MEAVPDGVSSSPNPDGFHHSRVPELSAAQSPVEEHGLLELVGFDAPNEEGLAVRKGLHQQVQTLLELRRQSGSALPSLGAHADVVGEQHLQEWVGGDVDELQQVGAQSVPVLLQEASGVVKDDAGKVAQAEGSVDVAFWFQIVTVGAVLLVQLGQHCLISAFREPESHNIKIILSHLNVQIS